MLGIIKKIASIFLVLCFMLPLSKCTAKQNPDETIAATNTYLYGFEMAKQGWSDLEAGELNGAGTLFAVFIVFFIPITCYRFKEQPQAVIYTVSAFFSGYILYSWVFLFATSPQIGGQLAVACWILLLFASIATLWQIGRKGAFFNRNSHD